MEKKKIAIIGGPDISAQVAERLKEHNIEVILKEPEEPAYYRPAEVSPKVMRIVDYYKGFTSFLPRGKKERIVGYYNPESDKRPNRNDPCYCGSGIKYKKCCFHTTHDKGKEESC